MCLLFLAKEEFLKKTPRKKQESCLDAFKHEENLMEDRNRNAINRNRVIKNFLSKIGGVGVLETKSVIHAQ